VLAHGRASSSRPFKPGLVGASPTTDTTPFLIYELGFMIYDS
jgi:hypothetical protein